MKNPSDGINEKPESAPQKVDHDATMKNAGHRISRAFTTGGTVTEESFTWLVTFLKRKSRHVELLDFSVSGEGGKAREVSVVLLVQRGHVGEVCQRFADEFPVPFTVQVLNRADPNPGGVVVTIGWGGGW